MISNTIKLWAVSLCAVVSSAVVCAPPAQAAVTDIRAQAANANEVFLQLDTVKGDVAEKELAGQIAIISTDIEIKYTGTKEGLHDVAPQGGEVTLVHTLDAASPAIVLAASNGQRFNKATLTFRRPHTTAANYTLKVTLSDLHVVSLHVNESAQEQFVLAFKKIEWEFRPTGTGTGVKSSWDIGNNKAL